MRMISGSPSFSNRGYSLNRRWPYQATVMKMLDKTSIDMVVRDFMGQQVENGT
jgi:hypothetical protein